MYTPIDVSERIEKLKQAYKSLPVPMETNPYVDKKYRRFCTGDRWMSLGYLRGWKNASTAETTRLRTAYAEAGELYGSEPFILEGELLAGHLCFPVLSEEEQAEYDSLCDAFVMSSHTLKERPPRKDHIALDFEKLLRLGIGGIIAEIEKYEKQIIFDSDNIYPSFEPLKRAEFYKCMKIELYAVIDLAKRYSEKALEMSKNEEGKRRDELVRISEVMSRVPERPAESFYEAVQSVQFVLSTLFGLYPLGRPDRYLYEYYKKDIESGDLTKEFAQELIDNFCLCVSDRVFTRAACGFIVGGTDENGELVENDLTYMFITALDHLKLPDPNGALAVSEKTGDELLEYATEVLSHGTTHPAFYNDTAVISSLVNNYGVKREDAVNYIHSTCAEISVIGKTRSYTTPYQVNMPKLLLQAVEENDSFESVDEILCALFRKADEFLRFKAVEYTTRIMEAARIGNEAIRVSAFIDDCIERGRSIYEGGERYMFIQPIFVGFATTVDSLIAIDRLVFKDKKLTLGEFLGIVKNDYKDNEELRLHIIRKLPHYGNDDEYADSVAKNVIDRITGIFEKDDFPLKKHMMPGTFTYINHATQGASMGATFDGRKAGYSYSDGCSCVQGRDVKGPTAMIKSLTSTEVGKLLGGMVVNIKFAKNNLDGENRRNFISILRSFIERGGLELQVNCVDRKTLERAEEHPEDYENLTVRIGGYSDYFIRLTPALRREITDRTEY